MDPKVTKGIRRMKRPHHNVYGLSDHASRAVISLGVSLWVFLLFHVLIRSLPITAQMLILAASFIPGLYFLLKKENPAGAGVKPYVREDGFEFLGLHDLKHSQLENCRDVLPREEEIVFMHRILEETIFPQSTVKQALCIAGPSGCGKSTIMDFFRQRYGSEYRIYDFSGNYHEFYGHMISLFGTNMDTKISELTHEGRIVFILDQFERFFFLSEKEQEEVRRIIRLLCRENTGIIVSLREEYLADFLKRFDMNNMMSSGMEGFVEPSGILKTMISPIEIRIGGNAAAKMILRQSKTTAWEYHRIKNNASVHLETISGRTGRPVLERMGATLLYCRSENSQDVQLSGEKAHASILESKCRLLFGENGSRLFRRHEHEPLIAQQIIFHMAEFNQKMLSYPEEELRAFMDQDNNELLGQYFDVQMASCGSFFHASRLLYLLSQARIHQLSISTKDIVDCLFPTLFCRSGRDRLMKVIQQLETLQLIRKNTEGSTLEYEIAHDYIAAAYLNYSSTNMDRNIKNALDLFLSEYMDDKRKESFGEKIRHRTEAVKQNYYTVLTAVSVALMVVMYLLERFVYNPWTGVWGAVNPYGGYVPAFPMFITGISVVYLCFIYDKTVKYYRGEKRVFCKAVYAVLMVLACMAVFAYPHFLFFDGVDLAVAAIHIALLLDRRYQQTCRNELASYGLKSCLIGSVFAVGHVFFFAMNSRFDNYLIFTEQIMFTVLTGYAFLAHMTQEFLYSRMADASSEQL